jgi:hypothetical protein
MAGPKNPEQLRGALGAFRRRLQEAERPKPPVDMKLDTGLDPSKAPVPVRPQFQAPMIPEEPTPPYKGVEDVASRLLNAPVDRRQFLEGARSGAAALSQVGKLGKLLPEKPLHGKEMVPLYNKALNAAIDQMAQHPIYKERHWEDALDPMIWDSADTQDKDFRSFINEELKRIVPKNSKVDPRIVDQMVEDLYRANERKLLFKQDSLDTDELVELLDETGPLDFPNFIRRVLSEPHSDLGGSPFVIRRVPPEPHSDLGGSPIVRGSDEEVLALAKKLGMDEDLKQMWQNAIESYKDLADPEDWPGWIRDNSWMKD